MDYSLLKFLHVLGTVLIGGGLIGVWMADLRSRQLRELQGFAEAVRNIAVFYDGFVVPGALLLLGSGVWMIVRYYDGWSFLQVPWLAGMVALFAFEFIEGNTVTRLYFMRLRRLTTTALEEGRFTPELEAAGTVRNLVSEAILMVTEGASYGYREGAIGPASGWPRSEGRFQQGRSG